MLECINVSSKSSTKDVCELILQQLHVKKVVTLRAIGAGAVNQMTKGIAVAQKTLERNLATTITFFNVIINEQEKSGIQMEVKEEL